LADDPGLRAAAAGWAGRVQVVTSACPERPALAALLVRPDGYVAWAADTRDGEADPRDGEAGPRGIPADTDDASAGPRDALHHWFGEPASSPAAGPPGPAPVPSNRFPKLGPWTIAR
jgi:hypothetical protein